MKNKRFSLAVLLLGLVPVPLAAQSAVWKVTSGSHTLYLGGTFHLLRNSDFPLPPEYATAMAAAQTLCFETDIAEMRSLKAQQMLLGQAMFQDGNTLQSKLSPEAWKAVQDYCSQSGMRSEQVNGLKPWMFMMQMAVIELTKLGVTSEGVDTHLQREGEKAGKSFAALETLEEQINYLTSSADGHESEYVISSLEDLKEIPEKFPELVAAWRAGDLTALDDLLSKELREKYPEMHRKLIVDRNQQWLPKVEEMLASDPVEFVLVGVGHLCGEEGLIAQLRKRGCTIEQIIAQ